jgi:hypothetical protein
MATKYTKWPQNIPNGHKIYQMATKYTKWPQNVPTSSNADPPKFTQIGIFGLVWQPCLNFGGSAFNAKAPE